LQSGLRFGKEYHPWDLSGKGFEKDGLKFRSTKMGLKERILGSKITVFLGLILAQCTFGGVAVMVKHAFLTDNVDPIAFVLIRNVFGCIFLIALAFLIERFPRIKREDWFIFSLLGLFGIACSQIFFVIGMNFTSSVNASLFQPICPVLTTLLTIIFRLEDFNLKSLIGLLKISGVVISAGGAILVVVLHGDFGTPKNVIFGNIAMTVNIFSYSIFVILQKKVLSKYPPVTTTAWSYITGVIFQFLMMIGSLTEDTFPTRWAFGKESWIAMVVSAFMASTMAFAVTTWTIQRTSPTVATAFMPLQVVAVVILSLIFLNYEPTWSDMVGALLVFLGLFCVVAASYLQDRKKKKDQKRAELEIQTNTDKEFDLPPIMIPEAEEHTVKLLNQDEDVED